MFYLISPPLFNQTGDEPDHGDWHSGESSQKAPQRTPSGFCFEVHQVLARWSRSSQWPWFLCS